MPDILSIEDFLSYYPSGSGSQLFNGKCDRNRQMLPQAIENARRTTTALPSINVSVCDRQFFIYGIVHGDIFNYLKSAVRSALASEIGGFRKPPEEVYRTEQGICRTLGLPRKFELKDVDYSPSLTENAPAPSLFLMAGAYIIYPVLFARGYASTTFLTPRLGNSFSEIQRFYNLMALRSVEYQGKFANFGWTIEFPQPLDLEINYLDEKEEDWYPGIASVPERSLWTARKLLEIRSDTVHYVGGFNHASQIAYFLQNPDYSFAGVENFRQARGLLNSREKAMRVK